VEYPSEKNSPNRSLLQNICMYGMIAWLPTWKFAKRVVLPGQRLIKPRRRPLHRWMSTPTVTHDRWLNSWAVIGSVAIPVFLGALLATPAGVGAYFTVMQAVQQNDSLRLIAVFAALNTIATVSGLMYLIGRNWSLFSHVEKLTKEVTSLRSTVDHVVINTDTMSSSLGGGVKKRRDVPATWRSVCSYLAIHPRLMKEMDFVSAGAGRLRLDVNQKWADMWTERLMNPELDSLEIVLFINRENSILTQSTGRTLLRLAKLLDFIATSTLAAPMGKVHIFLTEAAEVYRTFFIVKRNVSGRSVEVILRYSRPVDEFDNAVIVDLEHVEEVTETREKDSLRLAASRYRSVAQPVAVDAVRAVFRDILRAESFRPLKHHEWSERMEALLAGVSSEARDGFSIITSSSSEFQIVDHPFPWEASKFGRISGQKEADQRSGGEATG
jgi:hypothetical protein